MNRYIIWHKLQSGYVEHESSDETMITLLFFLGDGLSTDSYVDFLENKNELEGFFNISVLRKKGAFVTVKLSDDFFSHLPAFTTTINNLIKIIQEWNRLEDLVDEIKIVLTVDSVDIVGCSGKVK